MSTDGPEVLSIGEPGRAATELGACLPTRFADSADHELSECRVPGAQVRAASVRGLMHRYRRQPRQDRFSVVYDEDTSTLIVTVCDGVGQFERSQEAASFVAAHTPHAYLAHGNWHDAIGAVNTQLMRHVAGVTEAAGLEDEEDARMATTLVAAAIRLDPQERTASIAWTDDSSVWLLHDGIWTNLTTEDEGQSELHTGRVRALPHPNPRWRVAETPAELGGLFVLTDGVGMPLAYSQQVRDTLAKWWSEPPDIYTFAQQVGFARKGHLDDRTTVGVWFEPL